MNLNASSRKQGTEGAGNESIAMFKYIRAAIEASEDLPKRRSKSVIAGMA